MYVESPAYNYSESPINHIEIKVYTEALYFAKHIEKSHCVLGFADSAHSCQVYE